jgi:hypothetical protein
MMLKEFTRHKYLRCYLFKIKEKIMRFMAVILFILITVPSWAQIPNPTITVPVPVPVPTLAAECGDCPVCPSCARGKTETYREKYFGTLMLGYQYANTWVIGKQTASYTQILNHLWSLELEYATSKREVEIVGVELGSIREQRYTFFVKYYVGNSFHVSVGPYRSQLTIETSEKLQDISGDTLADEWDLEGYGSAFNFGSRWQTNWGLNWGFDWVRMNVPLKDGRIVKRGGKGENDAERSFKILRTVPTFTFFGANIGYTF